MMVNDAFYIEVEAFRTSAQFPTFLFNFQDVLDFGAPLVCPLE